MSEITCRCFEVEKHRIVEAIEGGCGSVQAVKELLGVTGQCASCQPDIEALLEFYKRFPSSPV